MDESTPTIRDLYSDLTNEELEEAEARLGQYAEVVSGIVERLGTAEGENQSVSRSHEFPLAEEGPINPAVPLVPEASAPLQL